MKVWNVLDLLRKFYTITPKPLLIKQPQNQFIEPNPNSHQPQEEKKKTNQIFF